MIFVTKKKAAVFRRERDFFIRVMVQERNNRKYFQKKYEKFVKALDFVESMCYHILSNVRVAFFALSIGCNWCTKANFKEIIIDFQEVLNT